MSPRRACSRGASCGRASRSRPARWSDLFAADAVVWSGLFHESAAIHAAVERLPAERRAKLSRPHWIDVSQGATRVNVPTSSCEGFVEIQFMHGDPFFWLNPENGAVIARNVAEGLGRVRPEHAEMYYSERRGVRRGDVRRHRALACGAGAARRREGVRRAVRVGEPLAPRRPGVHDLPQARRGRWPGRRCSPSRSWPRTCRSSSSTPTRRPSTPRRSGAALGRGRGDPVLHRRPAGSDDLPGPVRQPGAAAARRLRPREGGAGRAGRRGGAMSGAVTRRTVLCRRRLRRRRGCARAAPRLRPLPAPRRRAASRDARGARPPASCAPTSARCWRSVEGGRVTQAQPQPGVAEVARHAVRPRQRRGQAGLRPRPGQAAADPRRRPRRGQVARRLLGRGVRLRRREARRGIKEKYGPEAVLLSSTEGFQEVFFKNLGLAFGSPNIVRHPTLCLASVNLAYSMTFGTVPSFDLLNADYVIMSGANRFESIITPDTMDLIESTMNRKAKLVYLDPRFTVTAAKADEWYPIRPGTDLAFILAMLHVIIARGALRQGRSWPPTPRLRRSSREHVKPYTPEWAETETEIPAARHRPHRPRVRRRRAARRCTTRAAGPPGTPNDFQMRRAQAILNADRRQLGPRGRHGAQRQDRPRRVPLPALGRARRPPRVDEIEQHLPAGRQGRRRLPAGCARTCSPASRTRSRAGWSTSRTR